MYTSSVDDKVRAIFARFIGDSSNRIGTLANSSRHMARLGNVLESAFGGTAKDIAFHLADWDSDAAFVVAFLLFPDEFSDDELRSGATSLIVHVPNHLAAAAKLAGQPVHDVFGLGDLLSEM